MNPSVVVDFIANTRGLQQGLKSAERSSSGFGSKLKTLGKAGALAGGAAGIGALVFTLKTGIGEFQDAQKVGAQTNAVIKSTGGAAKITAEQVGNLSSALLKKSGVDDEVIQSGENVLLTFTNIRNEAGKGNDIFNQTTAAALDMSVALGTDMSASAMQLGKALNDPIKGMTRLTKSGVTFTDAQKEQVKAMQEAGDMAGAQKIILAELNKEFGGSAEALGKTLPGQIEIAKQTFNNFSGELVAKMIPVLQDVVGFIRDHWPEISATIREAWEGSIRPALVAMGQLVASVVKLIVDNWGTIGPIVMAVVAIFRAQLSIVTNVVKLFAAVLRGDWSAAWEALKGIVQSVLDLVVGIVRAAVAVIRGLLTALEAFIVGIANGIGTALRKIAGLFDAPADAARDAVAAIKGALGGIAGYISGLVGGISAAIGRVVNAIRAPMNAIIGAWNSLSFTVPTITLPSVTVLGKKIGGGTFGGFSVGFPQIPYLARGGIVTGPTLAMLGEAGPEAVVPLGAGGAPIEVRVFIGDQELRGLVRAEVVSAGDRVAQTLIGGLR